MKIGHYRDTIVKEYGEIQVQVYDDAQTDPKFEGDWVSQTHTVFSPTLGYSDSESGLDPVGYQNNAFSPFTYIHPIDLRKADNGQISFKAKWDIEANYDAVQFQISTDNGDTWIAQCGKYTVIGNGSNGSAQPHGEPVYEGSQFDWVLEEISLTDYLGQVIRCRFVLMSDPGLRADGFYFDDFEIAHNGSGLGMGESFKRDLKVYPNPTSSEVNVSFDQVEDLAEVSIVDLAGKEVKRMFFSGGKKEMQIKLTELETGAYFVTFYRANQSVIGTQKLIKY